MLTGKKLSTSDRIFRGIFGVADIALAGYSGVKIAKGKKLAKLARKVGKGTYKNPKIPKDSKVIKMNELEINMLNQRKRILKNFEESRRAGKASNFGEHVKREKEIVDSIGLGKNIENVAPSEIRFSQTSVNGSDEIIASMKANGWKGDPIDIVRMPDGSLTTLDNTRVAAAREVGIDVQATVRNYNDPLPPNMVARFTTPKGVPKTWGEATDLRIGKQKANFRNNNPMGSFDLEKMK